METGGDLAKGPVEDITCRMSEFGFRGVSSVESAGMGAMGYLANFASGDTLIGKVYANRYYEAKITYPALALCAEHSTMTAWGKDGEEAVTK